MLQHSKSTTDYFNLSPYVITLVLVWTLLMAAYITFSLVQSHRVMMDDVLSDAKVSFEKDVMYRRWVAGHGGVYVPVTDKTQPNPYLSAIPERDITTPSGRHLTLINSSYMTRQVFELSKEANGIREHIASLKAMNPQNAPDPWESNALYSFEKGTSEVYSIVRFDGKPYLRFMRPFVTEKSCLKCHAKQGYKEGDIRGGISISQPMEELVAASNKNNLLMSLGFCLVWLLGLSGIGVAAKTIKKRITERQQTEEELINTRDFLENIYDTAADGIMVSDAQGYVIRVNRAVTKMLGFTQDELIGKHTSEMCPQDEKNMQMGIKMLTELRAKGFIKNSEATWFKKDGSWCSIELNITLLKDRSGNRTGSVAFIRDITERIQSEAALIDSEKRYKELFNSSRNSIAVYEAIDDGRDFIIKDFNHSAEHIEQVRKDAVIGRCITEVFPGVREFGLLEVLRRVWKTGTPEFYPAAFYQDARISGWRENYIYKLPTGEVVAIYEDVTERKLSREKLIETKERLEKFIENSLDPIVVADSNGLVTKPNKAFLAMLGYAPEEIIGKKVCSLSINETGIYESTTGEMVTITDDFFKESSSKIARLLETGEISTWEAFYMHKSGKIVPITQNIILLYDEHGNVADSFCIIRDLTEQKKAEVASRISEARFRAITESSIDAIITADSQNKIIFCNRAAERMYGYSKEELIGQPAAILAPEHLRKRNKISFQRALQKEKPLLTGKPIEVFGLRKDNKKFPAEVSVTSYVIDRKAYFTSTVHDITERKNLEEKIRQSDKMQAIGTLAGGVAHDLNNLLSAMIGYPDLLLLNIPEDSPLRKPLLSIKDSGEKAAAIVNDLLTLARRGVNVKEVANLNTLITENLRTQQHEKLRCFHPQVEFEITLEPDLLNITGSPVHLAKTIMNLISNAAEAMPEGGKLIIATENRYLDKPINGYSRINEGEYVVLIIKDTGSGISREDLARIFEPFYTKKTMGRSGTGLGLAVVWGTVQDHQGYIEVDSVPDKGTTFTLYFPATRQELKDKQESLPIEHYSGNGERILVVDDVESQREIASSMLKKLNYIAETAASGEEAIEYIKSRSVDLVVLDMIMDHGLDGLETYKKILEIQPQQKAIIASGFSETGRVKEAQRLGAGAYIKKPYTVEKFGMAVKTELAQ